LIILATPVATIPDLVTQCMPYLTDQSILMDVASTKSQLIQAMRPVLGSRIGQFIFTHPIAGKARSGFAEAEATLFAHQAVVMTPIAENPPILIQRIKDLWEAIGAKVHCMNAEAHDGFYGRYSHLSNLLAYVLKSQWQLSDAQYINILPPSFTAMTRLAQSSPEMWRDICLSNRQEILQAIQHFEEDLQKIKALIQKAEPSALLSYFHPK
jgi:prephenate dehydrogenase